MTRDIPVAVPGGTTIRERYVQPKELVIEQVLNVQQAEGNVINHPEIMRPTEYTEETLTKEYQAPSREVYYQPVYEKKIVNNQEKIELVPQEDEIVNLNPVLRRPVYRENERIETVTRPGREIYNQTFIQPVI